MLKTSEITQFINEDRTSKQKRQAEKALAYYHGRHDIKDYKVYYFDDDGNLKEDETKANERISHPFFTEQVDQCAQYMLSGDSDYVRSDNPELQGYLNEYFDDDFKMELNDLLTYTSIEGCSYLYRYMGEDMKSKFKFADGLHVIEIPARYSSDKKDYIIYYYYWKTEKEKEIYKVEVWDDKEVHYFLMVDWQLRKDPDEQSRPHIVYHEGDETYYDDFGGVPFIRLDNNKRQISDLYIIKDLIDDYDLMACGLSNNIQDLAEGIYVVKGFNGHNMSELTQAIRVKKQVGVSENGDVDIRTINIPYEARRVKMELDEKNIYRFGFSFDASKAETSNVTNVVIKSRYALLDLKANKKEANLRRMMKKIIQIVLDEINKENHTAYEAKDVYMVFDREVPSNEIDNANIKQIEANTKNIEITTLLNVASQLDNETLIQNICQVLDIDYEEIKDKLPEDTEKAVDDAEDTLDGLSLDESV